MAFFLVSSNYNAFVSCLGIFGSSVCRSRVHRIVDRPGSFVYPASFYLLQMTYKCALSKIITDSTAEACTGPTYDEHEKGIKSQHQKPPLNQHHLYLIQVPFFSISLYGTYHKSPGPSFSFHIYQNSQV